MARTREEAVARVTAVVGVVALAACALAGAGGAAALLRGARQGWPGSATAVAVVVAVAALAVAAWGRPAVATTAGLALPVALVLGGVPLAAARAVSGPPLLALALAGGLLLLPGSGFRVPRAAFLPLVFALLTLAAARAHVRVGPEGDEPHYLMVAESLLRDGDVSLERDYAEGRYAAFHDAPLEPHYRVRGRHGEIYSLHAVGLSVLILPAWALAGYAGVSVFMALLAALLADQVRRWVRDLTGHEPLAAAAGLFLALSPPLVHYAGLVFTEVPAALAFAFGLRKARDARLSPGTALAVGLAAGVLPWLNVRYAPLAAIVVAHALWRHRAPRTALALVGPAVASALALAAWNHALYGFFDPRRVYGRRPEIALATLPEALPGLLLDQEFGLLVYAPILVLAVPGIVLLLRRDRRQGIAAALAVASVLAVAGTWHMWRGGFNPPGRFLVPIVPALAVSAALVVHRRGLTAGAALLAGWSLWAGIGGALDPALVHRDRDGTAPFFRQLSGAREWTGLLPGFVLEEPGRRPLAAIWAVALLAAVPWRSRRATAWRVAGACAGLLAAAEAATLVSTAGTGDRDAVRVVGRPAVAVPGWAASGRADARWTTAGLGWGPLYEPHRHPDGAAIGRRLPLPPGRYRLAIDAEDLSGGAGLPALEWAADRPAAPWHSLALERHGSSLSVELDLPPGPRAWNLRLRGGGPILIRAIRLAVQPRGPGLV
jgi:hypothetical protein